jgi:hypothetical protein
VLEVRVHRKKGRRRKEEGGRRKEEARKKKPERRNQKEETRKKKEERRRQKKDGKRRKEQDPSSDPLRFVFLHIVFLHPSSFFLRAFSVWAHQDSNLGQAGYEPAALTAELWARKGVYQKSIVASRR